MSYNGHNVLNNLSFTVEEGDFLSVVGENGSGKSTLVKGILSLMKFKGTLEFKRLSRRQIGYLPQQTPVAEDFPVTAGEVALSGCINSAGLLPVYKEKHRQKAKNALSTMGVIALEKRSFRELSGGQRQRVLIARALCAAEKLLLLDEPASGLDPVVRNELYALIKRLNKNESLTVIMVSHDLEGAMNADKILHISPDKCKSFFGTTADYKLTPLYKEMRCVCDD
jgi:zinc transport system ATP-binding protein